MSVTQLCAQFFIHLLVGSITEHFEFLATCACWWDVNSSLYSSDIADMRSRTYYITVDVFALHGWLECGTAQSARAEFEFGVIQPRPYS